MSVGPAHIYASVPTLLVVAACLVAARMTLQVAQARLSAATMAAVLSGTRQALVHAYLGASWPLQSGEREGRLQELLTTYSTQCANAVLNLSQGTVAAFNLVALMVVALAINTVAALAVALTAGAIGLTLRPVRAAVQRRSKRGATANLAFATAVTELGTTTREVRVFDVEPQVRARIDRLSDVVAERLFRTRFLSQLVPALYQGLALLLVVGALGLAYAAGASALASLGAVVLIMLRSLTYGQAIQTTLQALHESAPYFEAVQQERRRYEAAALSRVGKRFDTIREIVFEDVGFEYTPERPVLEGVSIQISRGEIIGVIGPSGAGKSTLVQLLLRLREPTHGRILADGGDVREFSLDDWYRYITFVPQEPRLFAGTVGDNIRFFRDQVEPSDVERAARRAHVHEDIMNWSAGYDTPVGERGGELSGGQRQRLCIARSLVGDPDFVVFDEPTSALDPQSEALMRDTMTSLASSATVLVIAHRMSTISICDRIMVIQNGRVQRFDEPTRLEEADPFYKEALRLSGMR